MGKAWLWVGGLAIGSVIGAAAFSFAPHLQQAFFQATAPKSMCSEEGVLSTLKQLASDRLYSTYGPARSNLLFWQISDAINSRTATYEISGIRNLGFIEGNGGSKCAAMVRVRAPGSGFSEEFSSDYSVELPEDKQGIWVRARFSLNR